MSLPVFRRNTSLNWVRQLESSLFNPLSGKSRKILSNVSLSRNVESSKLRTKSNRNQLNSYISLYLISSNSIGKAALYALRQLSPYRSEGPLAVRSPQLNSVSVRKTPPLRVWRLQGRRASVRSDRRKICV